MKSSRTHFEAFSQVLGLEAYKSLIISCLRLEDSTLFDPLKMGHGHDFLFMLLWKLAEASLKIGVSSRDDLFFVFCWRLPEKFFGNLFFCLRLVFLGLGFERTILEKSVLDLGFIYCPWPRRLCSRLHL